MGVCTIHCRSVSDYCGSGIEPACLQFKDRHQERALSSSNFSPETKRSLEFRVLSRHFTILEKLLSREYPVSEEEEEEEKEEGGSGR